MSNHSNIVRVECDIANPYRSLVNLVTGGPIYLPRNRASRFEVGVRDKGIWQDIISTNYSSITLEVRPITRTGVVEISKTVNSSAFINCSEGSWNNRLDQHAVVDINTADSGLAMAGATERDLWLVITATKVSGGNIVTLAAGTIQMVEDGGQYSGNTPIAGDPLYYNTNQVDALIQAAMKTFEISANGYIAKPTIDENGVVVWDVRPAP